MLIDIKSLDIPEIEDCLLKVGEAKYRAKQIFRWLSRGITSFDTMSDISGALREKLKAMFYITQPKLIRKQVSKKDGTVKFLWELSDLNTVESVLMDYKHGSALCMSTQVGCKMGCLFCASAGAGFCRNLEPSEMLDQVLFSGLEAGKKISSIVIMGIGEPLDNFDNVIKFIRLVNDTNGINVGMRHIALSTCGLAERIDKLGEYTLQLTLSVSLHAPDNKTRNKIMPVNKRYPIETLMESCRQYHKKVGRRITFEYAVINGLNDSDEQAKLLAGLMRQIEGHVNLISLNKISDRVFVSGNTHRFAKKLQEYGVNVTVRRSLGADIDAACGQLRRQLL